MGSRGDDEVSSFLLFANDNGSNASVLHCTTFIVNPSVKAGGSIPILLIVFSIVLVVALVLFLVCRCFAPDFSRAGLVASNKYVMTESSKSIDQNRMEKSKSFSTILYENKHWYNWIVHFFFKLKYKDIRERCGLDATLYLSLHAHVTVLVCLMCVISLTVVLPINYLCGDLAAEGYPRATIINLPPKSGVVWVHICLSLFYFGLTAVFMLHYVRQLGPYEKENSNSSVMVEEIPSLVQKDDILKYLQEAMPNAPIVDVQMAYDVKKLTKIHKKLKPLSERIKVVDSLRNDLGIVKTIRVGWRRLCCCCNASVDARDYYKKKQNILKTAFQLEKQKVLESKRLNIAFITFVEENDAKEFCDLVKQMPQSGVSRKVKAEDWRLSPAPLPADIKWENLSVSMAKRWIKRILINLVICVLVFFFTTPVFVLTFIDEIMALASDPSQIPTPHLNLGARTAIFLISFLFFYGFVPFFISISCKYESYWTRSFLELMMFRKSYLFILVSMIFLPIIEIGSLFDIVTTKNLIEVLKNNLKCSFLPRDGAFFITYIVTTAFLEPPLKLLRLEEGIAYLFRRSEAKTQLQKDLAFKKVASFDFMYMYWYSWNMGTFAMVTWYSVSNPIILPLGVLFFVLNYYFDKYNIYYFNKPAHLSRKPLLHRSAVNCVIAGALFLQISTLIYAVLEIGVSDPRTIIMIMAVSLIILICMAIFLFGQIRRFFPHRAGKKYQTLDPSKPLRLATFANTAEGTHQRTSKFQGAFFPPVLRRSHSLDSSSSTEDFSNSSTSFDSSAEMERLQSGNNVPAPANEQDLSITTEQSTTTLSESSNGLSHGPSHHSKEHPEDRVPILKLGDPE